jgi:hypothetical protein
MTPASDPAAQLERAQQLLVEFLRVDLDLAFTLLRTAEIEGAANNTEHQQSALAKVRVALNSIRHLSSRVLNPKSRSEIDAKTDRLETALAAFDTLPRTSKRDRRVGPAA